MELDKQAYIVWQIAERPNSKGFTVAGFLQEKYDISASRLSQLKSAYEIKQQMQDVPQLSCDAYYLLGRIAKRNKKAVIDVYREVMDGANN